MKSIRTRYIIYKSLLLMLRRKPLIDANWLLGPQEQATVSAWNRRWSALALLAVSAISVIGWSKLSNYYTSNYVATDVTYSENTQVGMANSPVEAMQTQRRDNIPSNAINKTSEATFAFSATARSAVPVRAADRLPTAKQLRAQPENGLRQSCMTKSQCWMPEIETLVQNADQKGRSPAGNSTRLQAHDWFQGASLDIPIKLLKQETRNSLDANASTTPTSVGTNVATGFGGTNDSSSRVLLAADATPRSVRTVAYSAPYAKAVHVAVDSSNHTQRAAQTASIDGLSQMPTGDLIRMLGSVQPRVAGGAMGELQRRGLTEDQLQLAVGLNVGSTKERIAALDRLMAKDRFSPVPWLAWMAEDVDSQVREHSIRLLGSIPDDSARRELRLLLNRETDVTLQKLLRHLSLASGNSRAIR